MRIAFISDVHGNAIALDQSLECLRKLRVDAIYFLGDAVGYMPAAPEVLDRLHREGIPCQQGNHEAMLLAPTAVSAEREPIYRLQMTKALLCSDQLQRLASWPTSRELTFAGRSLLLVHGSPRSVLDGYIYPDTELAEFHDLSYDAVVIGHTHRPFIRQSDGKWFVNVGSIGLPRDHGNQFSFAIYDVEGHRFEIVRGAFDVGRVLAIYGTRIAESVRACLQRSGEKG
jgi:putative phosphoesterase